MRFLSRCIHTATVLVTVFLVGAVVFFALGSVGLRSSSFATAAEWSLLALPWAFILFCAWGIWKKAPYALLVPALAVSGGLVIYLAYDDPVRLPPPDLGRVAPATSRSYETFRWFLKNDPHSRVPSWRDVPDLPRFPEDHAQWSGFFAQNREIFTQAWTEDKLGQEWVAAMATAEPEGIYPPRDTVEQPLVALASFMYTARARWGYAEVLMLDQKPDEAAALLLPFLRANYHLQRGGVGFLTESIAIIGTKGTYEGLERLINSGKLSPQSRSAIADALRQAPSIQLLIHQSFLGEEITGRAAIDSVVSSMAEQQKAKISDIRFLQRLLFNPHRTERKFVDFMNEARRLSELHQLEAAKKLRVEFDGRISQWRIKNPAGQMILRMMLPIVNTENLWKGEDQRGALLRLLQVR
jgi:hypothetical protein